VVAKQHPALGGYEVTAVSQPFGWCSTPIIQPEHTIGKETAVESVAEEIGANGGEDQPCRADSLAPMQCENTPGHSSGDG
jgi:hypothetical protein